MRYSDAELGVIKNTFADRDDLLKKLRAFFLDKGDKVELSEEALKVVRKTFLPEIEIDAPLHQIVDLYLTLDIKNKTPDETRDMVLSREILIKYFNERLVNLEGKEVKNTLDLDELKKVEGKSPEEISIDMNARNTIIFHLEQCLMQLKILAGSKEETPEQTKERLQKDSSK